VGVVYNPMTGTRRDLEVSDEPTAVAAARWKAKRIEYLKVLLAAKISDHARASYERELATLQ